jgi:hypothetical protein
MLIAPLIRARTTRALREVVLAAGPADVLEAAGGGRIGRWFSRWLPHKDLAPATIHRY